MSPHVVKDEADVVTGDAKQGVDGVVRVAEQVIAIEPAIGLHEADGSLDRAASFQFALSGWAEASALARADDPLGFVARVVPVAFVGIEAFGFDVGNPHDLSVGMGERVAVVEIAGKGLRSEDEALAVALPHKLGWLESQIDIELSRCASSPLSATDQHAPDLILQAKIREIAF